MHTIMFISWNGLPPWLTKELELGSGLCFLLIWTSCCLLWELLKTEDRGPFPTRLPLLQETGFEQNRPTSNVSFLVHDQVSWLQKTLWHSETIFRNIFLLLEIKCTQRILNPSSYPQTSSVGAHLQIFRNINGICSCKICKLEMNGPQFLTLKWPLIT